MGGFSTKALPRFDTTKSVVVETTFDETTEKYSCIEASLQLISFHLYLLFFENFYEYELLEHA